MEKVEQTSSMRISKASSSSTINLDQIPARVRYPPTWDLDKTSPYCNCCHTSFTILNRRSHCRRDGKIYCKKCTNNKISLLIFGFNERSRVCHECFEQAKLENFFIQHHLPILLEGGNFFINIITTNIDKKTSSTLFVTEEKDNQKETKEPILPLYRVAVSQDWRQLFFKGIKVEGKIKQKTQRYNLLDIQKIDPGLTPNSKVDANPDTCFSIMFEKGPTFEIVCPSSEIRNLWIISLNSAIQILNFDLKYSRQTLSASHIDKSKESFE